MREKPSLAEELRECYDKCQELFDIAWKLNDDENTRTVFTQKVTSYMGEVQQTLGYCKHLVHIIEKDYNERMLSKK